MKKDIPFVSFNTSSTKENFGFEIISIEKIRQNKDQYSVDPESLHQLKFYNLIFFTEGIGKHFIDFNWYPVKKNTLVYLTKEQINSFLFNPKLNGFCIVFTEDFLVRISSLLNKDYVFRLFHPQLFSPIIQISENSNFITYINLFLQEYNNTNSLNKKNILQSLFTILLSKTEHIEKEKTFQINDHSKINLFQKFNSLLEENFTKTRNAEFYAAELAVSYKHLNLICKELLNKTAKNVIDDFIILQAKRNLINSTIKSTELAYKLGFNDPTNFTKYFKKNTELTPKDFQKTFSKRS